MRKILSLLIVAILGMLSSFGQVITSEPIFPVASNPVTIYFHAAEGNGGLAGFTGDVYAHAGVITENSTSGTDWKYVKNAWPVNTDDVKLSRISENEYSLEITPSIREYYGVPEGEEILQLAFVFRNADGSITGKDDGGSDIFVDLYTGSFKVSVISPEKNQVLNPASQVNFMAASTEISDLSLYLNNSLVKTENAASLNHTFDFNTPGDFWLKVTASASGESDADSVFVHVLDSQPVGQRPDGLEDGITYINDQTVTLVLYAPGKEHAFAIGDFNNWIPTSDSRMTLDNDRFWITLNNLTPGTEYAFQYQVDGDILVADPYAEKILDPSNDKWISNATYPDLIPYPEGRTSGMAGVLSTESSSYPWQHGDFTPPEKSNLVIYELLLRDFLAGHDWKTLKDTLDYLENLGVNAIQLMPFNEFSGNESWGYNPINFLAPDKYYGPAEDLKAFVDECHARGIAVIQDIVFNHIDSPSAIKDLYTDYQSFPSEDNPWLNADFDADAPGYQTRHPYSVFFDFDHSTAQTQYLIDRTTRYWLEEFNIDGFRFDLSKGITQKITYLYWHYPEASDSRQYAVYDEGAASAYNSERIGYLKRAADAIWSVNADAYVIQEHFCANTEEKELADYGMMLWGNHNSNYNEATMGYHDNGKSNFSGISYKSRGWDQPHLVGYMESHDEERLMFKNLAYGNGAGAYDVKNLNTALKRIELAASFFFTIPGPKMIWQFGELGYDYSIEENGRVGNKPIRWDYYNVANRKRLFQVYSALINLKLNQPAFSTSDFSLNVSSSVKRIELNHADMDVRIIGNFDVVGQTADPNFSKTGSWYEYFTGEVISVTDPNALISLNPGEYRLYTTKKLETPDIIASQKVQLSENSGLLVYPVPANENLYVEFQMIMTNLTILDINGRILRQDPCASTSHHLDVSVLKPGMYLLKVETDYGQATYQRFVKR